MQKKPFYVFLARSVFAYCSVDSLVFLIVIYYKYLGFCYFNETSYRVEDNNIGIIYPNYKSEEHMYEAISF